MASKSLSRYCVRAAAAPSTSFARSFMQLAPRRALTGAPLDFLAPRVQSKDVRAVFSPIRTFSTSSPRKQTNVLLNPRTDDDGNVMMVDITPKASKRLKQLMTKESNPYLALRITVESGGCHGFQYSLTLVSLRSHLSQSTLVEQESTESDAAPLAFGEQTKEDANFDPEEDTIFEADDGVKVIMDAPSLELLKGSKIDFLTELIGREFKIVDNPLATSSCGCGTSFDIKF